MDRVESANPPYIYKDFPVWGRVICGSEMGTGWLTYFEERVQKYFEQKCLDTYE